MKKIWQQINNHPKYEISNTGLVRNNKARIMKFGKNTKGYHNIHFPLNGKQKSYLVHRLVALHFIPNPGCKPCVNHINGNKKDNRVENLEWCTNDENMKHAKEVLHPNGWGAETNKKPVVGIPVNGGEPLYLESISAGKKLGFKYQGIQRAIKTFKKKGAKKIYKGYYWFFKGATMLHF